MNVRITSNNLRFKISNDELNKLTHGESLTERVDFSGRSLHIIVKTNNSVNSFSIEYKNDHINFYINDSDIKELESLGRNKKGLVKRVGNTDVTLQVDYLTQRR
jgi:hypothetical protein